MFEMINEAWLHLNDPRAKAEYDAKLSKIDSVSSEDIAPLRLAICKYDDIFLVSSKCSDEEKTNLQHY